MHEEHGSNCYQKPILKDRIAHLLFIPDGHRSYASKFGLSNREAYLASADLGFRLLGLFETLNVCEVTYFLVSTRTLERDKQIVSDIFFALDGFLSRLSESLISGQVHFQVKHYGDRSLLPLNTVVLLDRVISQSPQTDRRLNLLVGYSGTRSLLSLAPSLSELNLEGKSIGESKRFDEFLRKSEQCLSKVEIVLRSGEFHRLSDAPLVETLNSVFILIPKLLPEIQEYHVKCAIEEYLCWKTRKRKGAKNEHRIS